METLILQMLSPLDYLMNIVLSWLSFSESWAQIKLNPVAILLLENWYWSYRAQDTWGRVGNHMWGRLQLNFVCGQYWVLLQHYVMNGILHLMRNLTILCWSPHYEEENHFDFVTSTGTIYVRLQVSDTETEDGDQLRYQMFIIQVPESELKIPNVFT